MCRTGIGGFLLLAASALVTHTGCVSPAATAETVAVPTPEERVTVLEAEVAALEAEVAAAYAEAEAALEELDAATAGAMSAEEMAAAAQEETARASAAVVAAVTAASAAQAEAAQAEAAVAAAETAAAEARAETAQAQAAAATAAVALAELQRKRTEHEGAVQVQDTDGHGVVVPAGLDLSLLNLDSAQVSLAGPSSFYLSRIGYRGGEFSARLRYAGDNRAAVEALYVTGAGDIPAMDLSAPALDVVASDTLVVSNIGIGGVAYAFSLRVGRDGAIAFTTAQQGHRVRTTAELLRDELMNSSDARRLVRGFGGGVALPGEGVWSVSGAGTVRQTDTDASHAKFAFSGVAQPAVATLYGVVARADGGARAGFGLHFLASETPWSGNTWNFGHSYLIWMTREKGFYGTDETQAQLYESLDGNRLVWRKSRSVTQSLSSRVTLEALYDPNDCAPTMGGGPCHGSITVLVDGMEQFKLAVSAAIAGRAADTVALRVLGGPVEFSDLYVYSR